MSRSSRALLKAAVRPGLEAAGLLAVGRGARRQVRLATDAQFRRDERARAGAFHEFQHRYGRALGCRLALARPQRARPRALVVSIGYADGVKQELGIIKGLQLAGFTPIVLTWRDRWLIQYGRLAGVRCFHFWDSFVPPVKVGEAVASLGRARSFEDLLAFRHRDIRVGRFASASAFRALRIGSLNLQTAEDRGRVAPYLADSMAYAVAAERIVAAIRPALAVFVDKGYTPHGQLFDQCLAAGIETMTWNNAHRSNHLILKRYSQENRDAHPASLSEASWALAQRMEWTDAHRQRLHRELRHSYASGDWFREVGTQVNKPIFTPAQLQQQLGLDPRKKTAVVFPHILWDGTFFWGTDLFENYETWLIETIRAACVNPHVNWVIRLHPANVVKNARDGCVGTPAEAVALQRHIGALPPHVALIPAESPINTYSLFELMEYGVTVRGTIGIEAASFGIPVLTAGTGRYDRRGFTVDSASREDYLSKIRQIHQIPRLSPRQQELAERFAYGVFVLRPLPLSCFSVEYQQDEKATCLTRIHMLTAEQWRTAPDLQAFVGWLSNPTLEDFLLPPEQAVLHDVSGVALSAPGMEELLTHGEPTRS